MEILFPTIWSNYKTVLCLEILYILPFGYKVLLIFIRSNLLLKWSISFITGLSTLSINLVRESIIVSFSVGLLDFYCFCFMNFKATLSVTLSS